MIKSVRPWDERQIGMVDLEDNHYVRIVATNGLATADALEWASEIIVRKQRELAKPPSPQPDPEAVND